MPWTLRGFLSNSGQTHFQQPSYPHEIFRHTPGSHSSGVQVDGTKLKSFCYALVNPILARINLWLICDNGYYNYSQNYTAGLTQNYEEFLGTDDLSKTCRLKLKRVKFCKERSVTQFHGELLWF